jgi:hypothetical protein
VTGVAAFVAVSETLGGKNPWVVERTSNLAEAWGVLVPMPTWAANWREKSPKMELRIMCFIKGNFKW